MKCTFTPFAPVKRVVSVFVVISLLITLIQVKLYAQQAKQRVYATSQRSITEGVCVACNTENAGNAVDVSGDFLNSASTISVGLSVLGGKQNQELIFPAADLPGAGTGAVVKLGTGGILNVSALGAIKVQAFNNNTPVGTVVSASSAILKLLAAGNQAEIFVPAPGSAYDRLRVTVDAGLLSVSANIQVYAAYFLKNATTMPCDSPVDELHGIEGNIAALGGVIQPRQAIDQDEETYSTLNAAVALAAFAQQMIVFMGPSLPGDSVSILVSTPAALVEANLLNSIAVETFNGESSNGTLTGTGSLLRVRLLSGGGNRALITFAPNAVFDRVQVRLGGLLNVLAALNLHEVKRIIPTTVAINGTVGQTASLCSGQTAALTISNPQASATYRWYTQSSGGSAVATGTSYTPGLTSGINRIYVEASRSECTNTSARKEIIISVSNQVAPTLNSTVSVCTGTSATLKVNNVTSGHSYRWYEVSSGGSPVYTGDTFVTPSLSANKTYYVESVLGSCISNRVAANVVVTSAPAIPQVTTNSVSINTGESAVLSAETTAGNTIRWFAAASGGNALSESNTYTTPTLNATTTYYVESVNASGCASARVAVLVTVLNGGSGVNCNAAVRQQSGIDGILCLLCGVEGAGNSTDANPGNFTKINLAAGVVATGYQRLIFANAGITTDSIRIQLEVPVGLADLGVLSGISLRVMNGTNVVGTYGVNSSLVNLRLLGGSRFSVTVPANGVFDGIEVRFGGLASVLTSLSIYGAEIVYPKPTIAMAGLTVCSGNTATIQATPNGGTSLRWFNSATGGTALASGNTYTTPTLSTATTYYIEVSRAGCANTERVPVNVNVSSVPANPVVTAVSPVCAGSSATLAVTSPIGSISYHWYSSLSATTPVFTGPVFTTPALNSSTTYYVQAVQGTCLSPSRTSVSVTVNARPVLPQVHVSASNIQAGQSSTLTATSSEMNNEFNWYTSEISTTRVATGAVFVTPPLSSTTTYYLEAKSTATGCTAVSRVQVTIVVSGPGSPSPVPCEAATTEVNGVVNGIALLSGVFNPGLAIDNDTRTGSSLILGIGALNASVYQRLGFGTLSAVGDTVRLLLSAPGKILSAGLLSSIRVSTYNGATANNDGLSLNDALIRLELLSGDSEALISFVPANPFNYVEVRLNSGIAGALSSVDVNYAQRLVAAPRLTSSAVTICAGATATLTVQNPRPGMVYKWYNSARVYQTGKDGVSFVTPVLNADSRFFVEGHTAAGCASARVSATVTVTPAPATPVLVSPTISTCAGADVLLSVSNPVSGLTYKWYNASDVYQAGKDGPTFSIVGVSGTVSYKVEAVNSCGVASTRAIATVNVGTLDLPVVTPSAVTISSGSPAVLTASSGSSGAVFQWYDSPSSGSSIATGSQFISSPLVNTGTSSITVTFYVTATVPGGCPASGRAAVVVTVLPAGSSAGVPCEGATIARRQGVDGIAVSGVFNAALAVDNDARTASSLVMPVGVLGASVYQHVAFPSMSVIGDTVRLRVTSPGKLLSVAVLPSIELTTYRGTVSNNDMITAGNALVHVELLSDNSGAVFSFVPAQLFDGVELRLRSGLASVLTAIDFNYAQRVVASSEVQSAALTACTGNVLSLSVKNPLGGTVYKWYKGTTYLNGKDGSTLQTDVALTAGTHEYYVTATRNGCESLKTKVTVTILSAPEAPVPASTNPVTTCVNTSVTLRVNAVNGIRYNWYDALTGGNLIASNTSSYSTPANLPIGTSNYYVEAVSAGACSGTVSRTRISLTIQPTSSNTDLTITGNTTVFCAGTTANLSASSTTVSNPEFTWYSDAALTNAVFTGNQFTTPVLTTTTTYYVTVKGVGYCENAPGSAVAVTLNVSPSAIASDITIDGLQTSYCAGNSARLTASTTTVNNPVFTWYTDAALTNVAFTGSVFNSSSLPVTTTYYVTVSGTNKCQNTASGAKVVTVTVNSSPESPIVESSGLSICSGDATTLAIQNVQTGVIYEWYSSPTGGTVLFTGSRFTTTVLTANTDYYVVASSPTGCGNATGRIKVTVVVAAKPSVPTLASTSVTLCSGSTATLSVTNAQSGVTYKWYSSASGGTPLFTGTQFTSPALTAGTTYYVEASSGSCTNSTRVAVALTIMNTPVAPTSIAGAANPLCAGGSASLGVNNPVNGLTYRWYATATGGSPIFEGLTFTTPALTATTTYYVEASAGGTCASTTRTSVTVNVLPVLAAPVINVQNVTSTSITFGWNTVVGAGGYEVSLNGGTTWTALAPGVTSYSMSGLNPGQTVTISVRATGQQACQSGSGSSLTASTDNPLNNEVFVPNTFTPNGDGQNDILLVYGNNIKSIKLRIYNQWGQFIYQSLAVQNGWDGQWKGVMQPNGVYVYQLEAVFNDGSTSRKKGTITLLR